MRRKLIIGCLVALALTGCSSPWHEEAKPSDTIVQSTLPPDAHERASKQAAREFVEARAQDGTIYKVRDSIKRVFGGWEKGTDRAFIVTSLSGDQATTDNGRLIANSFSNWQNSETGDGRVSERISS